MIKFVLAASPAVKIDLETELESKTGVLNLPTLFAPNFAAQLYSNRYTSLKKEYVHNTPRIEWYL
jgi:hypothetical protein